MQLAREALEGAEEIVSNTSRPKVAAREAYLAVLHAARAVIFERTGKIAKTYVGTHSEIGRLAHTDPRIDPAFGRFLKTAFDAKLFADYGQGRPVATTIPEARAFVATAQTLVAHAEWLLAQPAA